MLRARYFTLGLLALFTVIGPVGADDTQENPEYKRWAVWKVGAFATLRGDNAFGGMNTIVTTTHTLKEVTPEKLIIEYKTVTETNGQKHEPEPATMEVMAREPKVPDEVRKQLEEQAKALAANFKQTKGKETLTIKGKKIDCEWVRSEGPGNDTKAWSSSQIPGETVKTDMVNGPLKSKMVLIDWGGEKK